MIKICILFSLITSNLILSQNFQSEIIYTTKKKFFPNPDLSQEINKEKEIQHNKLYNQEMVLIVDGLYSVYKEVPKLENIEDNSYKLGFIMGSGGFVTNAIYKDIKNNISIEQREYLGKLFLVKDSLKKIEWQITNKTKKIGKYTAIKAIANSSNNITLFQLGKVTNKVNYIITAWFTLEIPLNNGPHLYQGLPGLILELNLLDTEILFKKITINPEKKLNLKMLKRGQSIDIDSFNNLVSERNKN